MSSIDMEGCIVGPQSYDSKDKKPLALFFLDAWHLLSLLNRLISKKRTPTEI